MALECHQRRCEDLGRQVRQQPARHAAQVLCSQLQGPRQLKLKVPRHLRASRAGFQTGLQLPKQLSERGRKEGQEAVRAQPSLSAASASAVASSSP